GSWDQGHGRFPELIRYLIGDGGRMSGGARVVGLLLLLLSAAPPDGLAAQGEGGATVRFSGYIQPRFQGVGDSATFLLRRARFALECALTPRASSRAQGDV